MKAWAWIDELYAHEPPTTLYHYTGLSGALGIVEKGHVYATELRYLNDTTEGSHLASLISRLVDQRLLGAMQVAEERLLRQLQLWVKNRMRDGHMVFTASFTTEGDQLSQWRGYCAAGKGVSLGFNRTQRWPHPFEHESGDDKWNAAGLNAVQRCPRRRAGVACDERTTDAVGISC